MSDFARARGDGRCPACEGYLQQGGCSTCRSLPIERRLRDWDKLKAERDAAFERLAELDAMFDSVAFAKEVRGE